MEEVVGLNKFYELKMCQYFNILEMKFIHDASNNVFVTFVQYCSFVSLFCFDCFTCIRNTKVELCSQDKDQHFILCAQKALMSPSDWQP